jgi:DNA-binding CsgD family transcriptional regulator
VVGWVSDRYGLTRRESQVLASAAEGNCTKETAVVLGVSAKTVEYFWARLYAKLRCRSQLEVMALLLRHACRPGEAGHGDGFHSPRRPDLRRLGQLDLKSRQSVFRTTSS